MINKIRKKLIEKKINQQDLIFGILINLRFDLCLFLNLKMVSKEHGINSH